jgi:general secretion pathway protein D
MVLDGYKMKQIMALLILLLLAFSSAGNVFGKASRQPVDKKNYSPGAGSITMNFKDVDLRVLIKFVSELTGKNFLVDPKVKGRATILSPEKISIEEAYTVFLSVLEVNGYTTVPAGKIIKIVPLVDARVKGVETRGEKIRRRAEDKVITQLIPLKYADASDLARLLRPLIPKTGLLISYAETNMLIVIDILSNIDRLVRIIGELDIPKAKEEIQIFPLKHANSEELAPQLTKLLQEKRVKKARKRVLKIIPDKRTNSLIVLATTKMMSDLRILISDLDKKQATPRKRVHVYALENSVAEDIAKVLSEIPGKTTRGGKGKAPVISKDVQISYDKATNSLVIIAEPYEYLILEGIIKKLDIPRTMVYVEALIMEVTATKALELGVEWRLGGPYQGGYGEGRKGGVWIGGYSTSDALVSGLSRGLLPSGLTAGVIGRAITLGDRTFASIGAFVRAISTDSDFSIIATPQILTLDNEEAVIEVGQNIPYVTSIDQATSTDTERVQTYEYRDVGITLKVTPHINQKGLVRLQIEKSIKVVLQSTALGGTVLAPTTAYRKAKTTIVVKNGQTAVLGGLLDNRITKGKNQVPYLGSVPILGWLFKDTSDRDEKTNLMLFLTPHVIKDVKEIKKLQKQKKEEMDKKEKKGTEEKRSSTEQNWRDRYLKSMEKDLD